MLYRINIVVIRPSAKIDKLIGQNVANLVEDGNSLTIGFSDMYRSYSSNGYWSYS